VKASITLLLILVPFVAAAGLARGGEFDPAIDTLLPRLVKIYGLSVGREAGYGTGVIVSKDGMVLTVLSLILDARHIRVVTSDGTRYTAEVIRRDPKLQLALLQVRPASFDGGDSGRGAGSEKPGPFPFFDVTQAASEAEAETLVGQVSSPLRPGDWVVTAGNPFKVAEGAEPLSIAHGVFSIRTRLDARRGVKDFPYQGDVLVMDAMTSNPGAPGSAVVNLDGEFLGMVGRVVTSNLTHTPLNYAIPRDVLASFLRGEPTSPLTAKDDPDAGAPQTNRDADGKPRAGIDLGIRLVRVGYQNTPPMVDRIRKGSIAEKLGLRKDDLILSVNGHSVKDVRDYDERAASLGPSDSVDLLVRRERQIMRFQHKPDRKP